MLRLKDKWLTPIEKQLELILWDTFFSPIQKILKQSLINTSNSALISKIRSGQIIYRQGVFSGAFSIETSRELSLFATFDNRSKTWTGIPPGDVLAAATVANQKRQGLYSDIESAISEIENSIRNTEPVFRLPIAEPLQEMDQQLIKDFRKVGVTPEFTRDMRENLISDYNRNQGLNIKNWSTEQTERMRDMVSRATTEGVNRKSLLEMFMSEWGVTKNKASFLAWQETSLFLSKLRRERSLDAGIRKYRWSTSLDSRVRPADIAAARTGANHRYLHGKIFEYGKPPIVNLKTGKRAEPGEDYHCRCVAISVL